MCGIAGVFKKERNAVSDVVSILKKLEYRGYDSAGVGILDDKKNIIIKKAVGEIKNLESEISKTKNFESKIAIGHTRWATHGKVCVENSHPHYTDKVAVVHNGIIENYREIKKNLAEAGYTFKTETDTEVIAVLLTYNINSGLGYKEAFKETLTKLSGSFAIIAFCKDTECLMFAKQNSPMVIGKNDDNDIYISSDVNAISGLTKEYYSLNDGDIGFIESNEILVLNKVFEKIHIEWSPIPDDCLENDICGFETFMLKEITEQPSVIGGIINHYFDIKNKVHFNFPDFGFSLHTLRELNIVACGSSLYAGLTASFYFEKYAGVNVNLHVASEFCTGNFNFKKNGVFLFISQSGETADTISALKIARQNNQHIIGLVNVKNSTIDQMSDATLYCKAGREIGVASTKAFTAQLVVLIMFALRIGLKKHIIRRADGRDIARSLLTMSEYISKIVSLKEEAERIAEKIYSAKNIIIIGRGVSYGVATEGALKIKELSYIPTLSIPAGELKHGSISLIDENTPVIVVGIPDETFAKINANIEEVLTRGGQVYLITNKFGLERFKDRISGYFEMPDCQNFISPILYVVVMQFIAYFIAKKLNRNIDRPRNLAKSVTVE